MNFLKWEQKIINFPRIGFKKWTRFGYPIQEIRINQMDFRIGSEFYPVNWQFDRPTVEIWDGKKTPTFAFKEKNAEMKKMYLRWGVVKEQRNMLVSSSLKKRNGEKVSYPFGQHIAVSFTQWQKNKNKNQNQIKSKNERKKEKWGAVKALRVLVYC